MADIDLANTVLIIKPLDSSSTHSLKSASNSNYLKSIHFDDTTRTITGESHTPSRECTPFVPGPTELQLHLQLEPRPRNAALGWIVGTNEKHCDIQLLEDPDKNNLYGISRRHFRLDFNLRSGAVLVYNISQHGTTIKAPSIDGSIKWLRGTEAHALVVTEQTRIELGRLSFELTFPDRGQYQVEYKRRWELFCARVRHTALDADSLNIQTSSERTPFHQSRKGHNSSYVMYNRIGAGIFGTVYMALEHSVGDLDAAKQINSDATEKQKAQARREATMLEKIAHVNHPRFLELALIIYRST